MHHLRLRQPDRERGAALFLAILTLFILTIMGIGLMFTTSIENTLAGTETKASKIFYAADSGVEYAGAMLSSQPAYGGGTMPVGMSSHYPGLSSPDIVVTVCGIPSGSGSCAVFPPVMISYATNAGDPIQSGGQGYGSNQFVEIDYGLTSSASSTVTQAVKAIDSEVGVYPKQLAIPR